MAAEQILVPHAQVAARTPAVGPSEPAGDQAQQIGDTAAHRSKAVSDRAPMARRGAFRAGSTSRALNQPWVYNALVAVLAAWVVHAFVEALLAASVIAIASWPLYTQFVNRVGRRLPRGASSLIFTSAITVFVLAPMIFAFVALLTEAQALLNDIAAADQQGMGAPRWLSDLPMVGNWLVTNWESQIGHAGVLGPVGLVVGPVVLTIARELWEQRAARVTLK